MRGTGIAEGTVVPKTTLTTAAGEKIELTGYAKTQKKKNLLLIFFRTGNCGICVGQLTDLASHYGDILDRDAALVAISLDDAIVQARTSEKIAKKYPILLDPDAKTVNAFDVFNPQDKLSRPSTFVLGPGGKVLYKYVGMSLTDRPATATILEVLEKWSGKSRGVAATPGK